MKTMTIHHNINSKASDFKSIGLVSIERIKLNAAKLASDKRKASIK